MTGGFSCKLPGGQVGKLTNNIIIIIFLKDEELQRYGILEEIEIRNFHIIKFFKLDLT